MGNTGRVCVFVFSIQLVNHTFGVIVQFWSQIQLSNRLKKQDWCSWTMWLLWRVI